MVRVTVRYFDKSTSPRCSDSTAPIWLLMLKFWHSNQQEEEDMVTNNDIKVMKSSTSSEMHQKILHVKLKRSSSLQESTTHMSIEDHTLSINQTEASSCFFTIGLTSEIEFLQANQKYKAKSRKKSIHIRTPLFQDIRAVKWQLRGFLLDRRHPSREPIMKIAASLSHMTEQQPEQK